MVKTCSRCGYDNEPYPDYEPRECQKCGKRLLAATDHETDD